jgi:hypothetical protein
MTIFQADLEKWFARPLVRDDPGEKKIRDAGFAFAVAILDNTSAGVPGFNQEETITRIQEACLLACASRRISR